MDPQTQTQTISPPELKSSKKLGMILAWILVVILLATNAVSYKVYVTTKKQLNDSKQAQAATQKSLTTAQAKLKVASFLPTDVFSPQCSSGNNDFTRIAPVNRTPIDGYNVYVVNCLKDLIAGKTNSGKIIAFKVAADGSQSFAYGAASGEAYCISAKIIDATAATDISTATGLPVCKSF